MREFLVKKNPQIDLYLKEGCGRCPLGGTPECKVHFWPEELKLLRSIALECGLVEELKWKVPCYMPTFRGDRAQSYGRNHQIVYTAYFLNERPGSCSKGVIIN